MTTCSSWRSNGNYSYCIATKECDQCTCNGDVSLCDFYKHRQEETEKDNRKKYLALKLIQKLIEDGVEAKVIPNLVIWDAETDTLMNRDEAFRILRGVSLEWVKKNESK